MSTGKKIAIIVLIIGIILGIIGGILFFAGIGRSDLETDSFTEKYDEEITKFDINCDIGELVIKYSSSATSVIVECVDVIENKCDVEVKDGTLVVDYEAEKWHKYIHLGTLNEDISSGIIQITLPSSSYEKLNISAGVGETNIEGLAFTTAEIDSGVGEFTIKNCTFTDKINIDTGIGEFNIQNSVMNNLDFDAGIGDSVLENCDLTGECSIENGIGEIDMKLVRSKDYYSFDVDNGIGTIDIDGQMMLTDEVAGKTIIRLENGIGEINVECA